MYQIIIFKWINIIENTFITRWMLWYRVTQELLPFVEHSPFQTCIVWHRWLNFINLIRNCSVEIINVIRVSMSVSAISSNKWAPPSEFVSSSIPSWQIVTAHAQPYRGARDLAFCLKDPLDSLLVWASSGGSGETARMRRLAWTFAARIGDKYQIRLTRPKWKY